MPAPYPQPSVLLLERTEVEPDGATLATAPGSTARPAQVVPAVAHPRTPPESLLLAPGLAVLAAAGVLESYRWFGLIADGASRPVALAFALFAAVTAVVLNRAGGTAVGRTVVAAAGFVCVATAGVLWDHAGWARAAVGVADLTMASSAMVALVMIERSRRRGNGAP